MMAKLFFLSLLASGSLASLVVPWVGVVLAYGLAILTPQAVWHWAFEGVRPVMWVLLPTIFGVLLAALRGKLNFSLLANRRAAYIALLWLFFFLSYMFGPFVSAGGPYRFHDPAWAMDTANKLFLLFFMGCVCLDDVKKLRVLVWVAAGSLIYLIYWANDQYLSGLVWGRLAGPQTPEGESVYADENAFALVFVVLIPYLWYLGQIVERKWLKWALWLAIPFGWHAIFLTASRGGLLGLAVVTLVMALLSRKRALAVLLIPALIGAYVWQAGDLMKERADTIDSYQEDTSASTRLEAWSAARAMMANNPVFGVGIASFGPAFPVYSNYIPREAHNTFFQISAESGIIAGVVFLVILISSLRGLRRMVRRLHMQSEGAENDADRKFIIAVGEATFASLIGFLVCAAFLSLQLYELFYFLCLVANVVINLGQKHLEFEKGDSRKLSTSQKQMHRRYGGRVAAAKSGFE